MARRGSQGAAWQGSAVGVLRSKLGEPVSAAAQEEGEG
jgi:hypothetical protein